MTAETAESYRLWVLRHWSCGGWTQPPDRVRTKKGAAAIASLIKRGDLTRDPEYDLYRATEAGLERLGIK